MEASFLACGAGGPQLKRNPLGSHDPEGTPLVSNEQTAVTASPDTEAGDLEGNASFADRGGPGTRY